MPTYFKPLRRKIGVVTLALACVFAGAWIRSRDNIDAASIDNSQCSFIWIAGGGEFLLLPGRYHVQKVAISDLVAQKAIVSLWINSQGTGRFIDIKSWPGSGLAVYPSNQS